MELFRITVKRGSNYAPADLMYRYAKEHNSIKYSNHLGRAVLTIDGKKYGFDHWEIVDNGSETETVNVFIFCVDHLI